MIRKPLGLGGRLAVCAVDSAKVEMSHLQGHCELVIYERFGESQRLAREPAIEQCCVQR